MKVFYDNVDSLYKRNGPHEKYVEAGLLEPETQTHKTLYADFTTGLGLQPAETQSLMNFLLQQKRNVISLFAKVQFLQTRRPLVARGAPPPTTLQQLDVREYQTANGVVCTVESLAQSALANPINIRLAQQDEPMDSETVAAQALVGLFHSDQGCNATACSGLHDVRMLLNCLQRLSVDD